MGAGVKGEALAGREAWACGAETELGATAKRDCEPTDTLEHEGGKPATALQVIWAVQPLRTGAMPLRLDMLSLLNCVHT